MAEPGARLRIEQPTLSSRTTRVWLNEQEIDAAVLVSLIGRTQDPALIEQAIRDLKQIKADLCQP